MRPETIQCALNLGSQHRGLVLHDELRKAGVQPYEIAALRRDRVLLPVRRGISRLIGARYGDHEVVLGCLLACGPDAAASHHTAAWLWGVDVAPSAGIHVTVAREAQRRPAGVTVHRSMFWDADQRTIVDDIPVVRPERMLVDLSGRLPVDRLGRMIDQLARTDLVTIEKVRELAEAMLPQGGRGRMGALFRALEERQADYHPGGSDLERDLGQLLVEAGLPRPVPQWEVRVGGRRFRLDFAYPEVRLGIEFQGFRWHGDRTAFDADAERSSLLASCGWSLLLFTSRSAAEHIVSTTRRALVERGVSAA